MVDIEKGLVSVIVPAYNVEKYLKYCIDSIIKQTYQNIEILIVEDGATDSTPDLADECAARDSRINVIHKKNEGVSIARNIGIDESHGEYIVFVDADDFLAPDYIEYMLSIAQKTGAEFCLSKNCYTKAGEKQIENDRIEKLSSEDGTALLLSPRVIVGCWNKMFKKSFLIEKEMRFSSNLFYGEGLSFITTASQKTQSIGVGERKVYYYRRNNEMSATTKFDIEKMRNGEKALQVIKDNLTIRTKKVETMWELHMCTFCLGALTKIEANDVKKEFKNDYCHWKKYLRKHYFKIFTSSDVSMYRKCMLLGGCISPWILMRLDLIRRKKISDNSVTDL